MDQAAGAGEYRHDVVCALCQTGIGTTALAAAVHPLYRNRSDGKDGPL